MEEQKKIEVGQTVWLTGGFRNTEPRRCVVSKVGNKYFYVNDNGAQYKFNLHNLKEYADSNYKKTCWLSLEDYEADRLMNLKRQKVNIQLRDKLTDEQVNAIYDILNP